MSGDSAASIRRDQQPGAAPLISDADTVGPPGAVSSPLYCLTGIVVNLPWKEIPARPLLVQIIIYV